MDELHQQKTISGSTLVSQEQESEATQGTGSPSLGIKHGKCAWVM